MKEIKQTLQKLNERITCLEKVVGVSEEISDFQQCSKTEKLDKLTAFELLDKGWDLYNLARQYGLTADEAMKYYEEYAKWKEKQLGARALSEYHQVYTFMLFAEKLGKSIREACEYYDREYGICIARFFTGDLTEIKQILPDLVIPRRYGRIMRNRPNVRKYPYLCAICGHGGES